jgi:8-oxo-dGTP pyrophosphatase MutT (NUDIX family)
MSPAVHTDFWAGGFLFDRPRTAVLLHHRDGNTSANPHKWAFFGGQGEQGESYVDCFVREMAEEIGLPLQPEQAVHLREYMNTLVNQYRVVFYVEIYVPTERLVLGEGAGFDWFALDAALRLDLAQRTRDDLEYFIAQGLAAPP